MKKLIIIVLIILQILFCSCASMSEFKDTSNFHLERMNEYEFKITEIETSEYFHLIVDKGRDDIFEREYIESMSVLLGENNCRFKYRDSFDVKQNGYFISTIYIFDLVDESNKIIKLTNFKEMNINSPRNLEFKYKIGTRIELVGENSRGIRSFTNSNDCFLALVNLQFSKQTRAEIEWQKQEDKRIAIMRGFSSVEEYYREKQRLSYENFYYQAVYHEGIPLKFGDEFEVYEDYFEVIDRVRESSGYTYLVGTLRSTSEDLSVWYERYKNGWDDHYFYVTTKQELNIYSNYIESEIHGRRIMTNRHPIKLKYIGKGQYQKNFKDVDCLIFSAIEKPRKY